MADYQVVDAEKLNSDLSAVANSIRAQAEINDGLLLLFPDGFISAVEGIKKGIIPTEIINITQNVSNMDITMGKLLNVNVPVPDGYINLADVISHCTRHVNSSYTPPSNQILNNVSITIKDSNGEYLKPKVFIMFHNARIENSGTDTAKVAVTASVTIAGDDGALLYRHSSGIYYHSTYKACSNQSSSRYFNPTSTGVQGVASDFYLQSGKQYLWYAWG